MSITNETAETAVSAAAKLSPPMAVTAGNLAGMTLPDLVQYATLLYLALLIAHKAWRMYKEYKTGKGGDESGE